MTGWRDLGRTFGLDFSTGRSNSMSISCSRSLLYHWW